MSGQSVNDIESGLKRAVSKIMSPPVLIAVSSALTPSDSFREKEDYAATACSIQNFCLSLWGNGIGTQWSTGAITRADSTYEALGIPKDREQIVGFLKAGYPETLPEKEKLDVEDFRTYLP
jgi:nitroreductase